MGAQKASSGSPSRRGELPKMTRDFKKYKAIPATATQNITCDIVNLIARVVPEDY
jgi:hypothetical protein